jgi:TBCC domain-containing protein 1
VLCHNGDCVDFTILQGVPGGLPNKYQKSSKQKEKQVEQWQKLVKEAGLSSDHRKQFQALVESRFQVM